MAFKFTKLLTSGTTPLSRSSHSLQVIGNKAYVFGGEHEPRVPINSAVHCLDMTTKTWSVLTANGTPPSARNAHAAATVGTDIYIYGGRTGIGMGEGNLNDLHVYDTIRNEWRQPQTHGNPPCSVSYHSMTAVGSKVFVFGGCGEGVRFNTLHSFDTTTNSWEELPTSNDIVGRGGAGLVSVGDSVYVIGGFSGKEMGDVHRFDMTKCTWTKLDTEIPNRSVFGAAALGTKIFTLFGEIDPSSEGHSGAGQFSSDVFCCDTSASDKGWTRVSISGDVPPARGWFPAATFGEGIIFWGGLALDNSRLDDAYLFSV